MSWPRRLVALLGTCSAVLVVTPAPVVASSSCKWTAGEADWQTTGDWDCGHVPTASDDVVIGAFGHPDVTSADAEARSVSEDAAGAVAVESGRKLTTSSSGSSTFAGHIVINGTGTLTLGDPTTFSFAGGQATDLGTLDVKSSLTVTAAASIQGGGVLHIASGTGSLKTEPGGSETVQVVPKLDNDGSVTVVSGTLELLNGDAGSTSGSYSIAKEAELKLPLHTFESPSVTGAGTVKVAGAVLTVEPTDTFSPGTLAITEGTATLNRDVSVSTLLASAGVRNGTGTLTVTGSLDFSASGSVQLEGGTTTIASSASPIAFGASQLVVSEATLNLDTPATWTANQWTVQNGAVLNVNSTLGISEGGSLGNLGGSADSLVHVGAAGTLTVGTPARTFLISPKLENAGVVHFESGTANAVAGMTQTGGSTTVDSGAKLVGTVGLNAGLLDGNGTLGGPLTNTGGMVSPGTSPGTLTIEGEYVQGAAGTMKVDIAGAAPGVGYDQLLVGSASLAGTLAIVAGEGFAPSPGEEFTILEAVGASSGAFTTLTGATVGASTYTPQYREHAVVLGVAVSAPVNSGPPSIPSSSVTGTTIRCEPGTWAGSPEFAFEWLRDGTPIPGAGTQAYTLTEADAGHSITCRVKATNGSGSTQALSNVLVPTVKPVPAPAPSPSPRPTPTPIPSLQPVPVPITQIASLPSPKACVSRRHFFIHLLHVKASRIVTATIQLNGHTVRAVRGRSLALPIDLRGLPKGTFTVAIITTDSNGKRLIGKRRFHTCVPGKHHRSS
jgi:hypothetical protein